MRRVALLAACLGVVACGSTAPLVPTQAVFLVEPASSVAGQAMTPAVQVAIEDASGKVVTTATTSVTLALTPNASSTALSGIVTANAVKGVATFPSLIVDKVASSYTLVATTSTFTPVTSTAFPVTPGEAAQMQFVTQPSTAVTGHPITPPVQVTVFDAVGNVATGFTGGITVGLGTNPAGATLAGTLTATVARGIASFANLVISNQGSGYTLVASASTLSVTSLPFVVDTTGTTGINYHGGPIIDTPKVAALYWSASVIYSGGPPPGTFGAPATADQSIVGFFLRNLGGSPYFNITTTYYDATNTAVQNVAAYTQYWADSVAPASVAPMDADIQTEIENGLTNGSLVYDPNTLYAVFTGTGINLGGKFGTAYCAYHGYFIDGQGRNVKYAAMPYDYDYVVSPSAAGCSLVDYVGTPNNDPAADAEVNTLSHEFAEAITDENLNAWYVDGGSNAGDEMADLCNFAFGPTFTTSNAAYANQQLGGKNFLVQMLWVNAETAEGVPIGCQQNWMTPSLVVRRSRLAPRAVLASRSLPAAGRHVMHVYKAGPR